jgi:small subunit ribosomal protein S17
MYTRRRAQVGVVVGNKMQKTVIVAVEKHKRHPLYKKSMRRTQRYKAHDEKGLCALGDTVRILESRPLSREKRWRVVEILARHEVAEVAPREIDQTILERIAAESPPPAETPPAAAPPAAEPEKAKKPARSKKAVAESEPEPPEAETVPEAVVEAEAAPEAVVEAEAAPEAVVEAEVAPEPEAEPETTEEDTLPDKE